MISPRNYFLFTPLLPSVAVGTLSPRSILQRTSHCSRLRCKADLLKQTDFNCAPRVATRYVTRHKPRQVQVIEAAATDVDVRMLLTDAATVLMARFLASHSTRL